MINLKGIRWYKIYSLSRVVLNYISIIELPQKGSFQHISIWYRSLLSCSNIVGVSQLVVFTIAKSFNDYTFILSPLYTWNQFWSQNKYVKPSKNETRCLSRWHQSISFSFKINLTRFDKLMESNVKTVVVQSLIHVRLFATPWTTAM